MVELFNIKLDGNIISCDYSPEHSGKVGKIAVNTDTEEIVAKEYSEYDKGITLYTAQVISKLMELFCSGEPIPEKVVSVFFNCNTDVSCHSRRRCKSRYYELNRSDKNAFRKEPRAVYDKL